MKRVGENIIIYRDNPMIGFRFSWLLIFFCLFFGSTLWATMIWVENSEYIRTEDIAFSIGLGILGILFLLGVIRCSKSLLAIYAEQPIFTISAKGIKYYNDRLITWTETEKVILHTDFDLKYLTVYTIDKQQLNYLLDGAETSEFDNLEEFKVCLEKFPLSVEIA